MKRIRLLLIPFSFLYWVIIALRNLFFDKGILKITKASVPVISIGNISAGGVGKTPIVEMIAEILRKKRRVSVLSRGYKRKTTGTVIAGDGHGKVSSVEETGDEPAQLSQKFPDLIVVADERRVRGAKIAIELGAEIIILDDGFQHRYLHRDVDIAVLAVHEILNGDWLLPAGNRREPIGSLKRSDVVCISRCSDFSVYNEAVLKLKKIKKPVIGMHTKLKSFRPAIHDESPVFLDISGKKAVAFSGIGDPESFEQLLKKAEVNVRKNLAFPDHHWYSDRDIKSVLNAKKESGAGLIVTTEKDVARLKDRYLEFLKNEEVVVAEICQKIFAGEDHLYEILDKYLK